MKKTTKTDDILLNRRHDGENPTTHESLPLKESIKAFFKIAIPYWVSKDSKFAWFQLVLTICLVISTIVLAKQFNDWYKSFWDFIQEYNLNGFIAGLIMFVFLATLHVCSVVYKSYVISAMSIRWRKWLSNYYLERYLSKNSYYTIQLTDQETDNPDQRIAEDLNSFVNLSISLIISILTDLSMLITFVVILWSLSASVTVPIMGTEVTLPDGYMLYLAIAYAVVGTLITFIMGKPLVLLNFRQQRFEADFRYALIRVRENAESVALYKGEEEENKRFKYLFRDVVSNYIYLIKKTKSVGFFTLSYAQTAVIFPIIIAAPMYFAHIITMGSIIQINSAFGRVQDSLSTLIQNFTSLASWKAVIDRLALFEKSINKSENLILPQITESADSKLRVKNLTVKKPNGETLLNNYSLELNQGESLLIKGHSGCGKSTFIRSLAGIWPFTQGEITLPKGERLFLSQKPYMPLGTLKDAICYPSEASNVTNENVAQLLDSVGLDYLKDSLNKVELWGQVLSLGEQQRISFLRAIINKPQILFMDEVTSALDEENETKMYKMIKELLPNTTIISVGHRSTLIAMHSQVVDFSKL